MTQPKLFAAARSAPPAAAALRTAFVRLALPAVLGACLTGCSLISLKSPEKPLSTRDLNARILTHEYSVRFIAAVAQSADQIAAASSDPEVRRNALRWKIVAASASEHAASQMSPMLALLDAWSLSVQMRDFLSSGAGQSLFGAGQPQAVTLAQDLAGEAEDMARELSLPDDFARQRSFIVEYASAHPLKGLDFARASVVDLWARESGTNAKLVDTLGTVPEAMAQAGDLVRMYGDNTPTQMLWRAQLAAQDSGLSGVDVQAELHQLNERMAEFTAIARQAPDHLEELLRQTSARFNGSFLEMMHAINAEGATLSSTASEERQALVKAVDEERAAVTADTQRIAGQLIREAGEEARRLIREAVLLIIVAAVVLLGLPFAAGYLLGQARGRRARTST